MYLHLGKKVLAFFPFTEVRLSSGRIQFSAGLLLALKCLESLFEEIATKEVKFRYPRNDRPPNAEKQSQAAEVFPEYTPTGR